MGWEIFDRKTTRTVDPRVTLTTLGRVALNRGAASVLEKIAAEHVFLLWDSETSKCAIKVTGKKDQRAYKLHYGQKGNGAGFSAVTFLNHIKYDWSESRMFPIEWNEAESMFTFSIPVEHLTGSPKKQNATLGKLRRADRAKKQDQPLLEEMNK
jgi:hypothetical protein